MASRTFKLQPCRMWDILYAGRQSACPCPTPTRSPPCSPILGMLERRLPLPGGTEERAARPRLSLKSAVVWVCVNSHKARAP